MSYSLQRNIPEVERYEVVVVGGGMAGVGAACAAARQGARTLLIERFAQLGGNATLAGVGNWAYRGLPIGQGRVFDDILVGQRHMRSIGKEHGWESREVPRIPSTNNIFDHSILPIVIQHVAKQSGVDLLFHTELVDVIRKNGRIEAVVIHNKSLLQAVSARIVIDATGDGIVSQHAGAESIHYTKGEQMPGNLQIFLREVDDAYEQPILDEDPKLAIPMYRPWMEPGGKIGLKTRVYGSDTGSGKGMSDAEQGIRRLIPHIVRDYQKNHRKDVKFDYAVPMIGVREGGQIVGDIMLSIDDIDREIRFPDAVAFGVTSVDTVNTDTEQAEKRRYADPERITPAAVPPFQIPYGCLTVAGLENLLVAGRCLSADRLAMSCARVMATCCMMGQAVGIAAAQACRNKIAIREVDSGEVRERLMADADHQDLMRERLAVG